MTAKMRIKDVAREAGVSTATVSHVINNTRFVSEATRARVMSAIEGCNYYPNAHARSLASGRSSTLGLLISDISNPFFPELVKSIETVAFERGYEVILANTNYNEERTLNNVKRQINACQRRHARKAFCDALQPEERLSGAHKKAISDQ